MDTRPYELYISLDHLKNFWQCETNWRNEMPLRAILIALEFSFLTINEAAQDPRSTVSHQERLKRLFLGCCQQIELLREILDITELDNSCLTDEPSKATNLQSLFDLEEKYLCKLKKWGYIYNIALAEIPFNLGIEPYIDKLQVSTVAKNSLSIPYDKWINPQAIAELFHIRDSNPEDKIFATVHQITECWLFVAVHLLNQGESAAQAHNWQFASEQINKVCSILNYLTDHILLLETMVVADYHPLRVSLRDASGAQSKQSFDVVNLARALFPPIQTYLSKNNCSLLDIYHSPIHHTHIHEYIKVLSSLEIRLTQFFFSHYKLAIQILGSESLGSLGFEVQGLVKRFVEPLYADLDQVRYQYVIVTNFEYGQYAGNLISSLEPREVQHKIQQVVQVPDIVMENHINQYMQAISEHDIETWIGLFEPDASIEDPYGSRPFKGHHGLKVYFRGFIKVFPSDIHVKIRHISTYSQEGKAEFDWEIMTTHKTVPLTFAGTDIMQFSQKGKIQKIQVLQDTTVISQQLLAGFTSK